MANVTHASLTGAELHEPKGVDSASANAVYVANGSASGTWTVQHTLNKVYLTTKVDVNNAATVGWVYPGFAGDIDKITTVMHSSFSGDTVLSFEIGGTAVTNGNVTLTASGSAAGVVDSSTPSALNSFTAAQPIEIISDGGATGTLDVTITFELTRTS